MGPVEAWGQAIILKEKLDWDSGLTAPKNRSLKGASTGTSVCPCSLVRSLLWGVRGQWMSLVKLFLLDRH